MTTVVIPDDEKGDRLAGSSGVKVPVGWGKFLVRSVQGGEQLYTAAAKQRTSEAAKPSPHRKRMMGISGVPSR